MDIKAIQTVLQQNNIDAWALYDFRGSNNIAWKILGLAPDTHCTRRWLVIIPATGTVKKIVSKVEAHTLNVVDAEAVLYGNMIEWRTDVVQELKQFNTIAMEYSPNCDLPVVSKVDAGTIEWLKSEGLNIVSSADVAQHFQAVWTREQFDENLNTATVLRESMMDAAEFLKEKLRKKQYVTEFDVQQNIVRYWNENGLWSDSDPIVAIGPNASNPHYCPTPQVNSPITIGDTILIDMWAKTEKSTSTYADITWMFYAGDVVPDRVEELFTVISDGRDAALKLVQERFTTGKPIMGYEVDDACRDVIQRAGYGEYFIHRTGHNIAEETHGSGANMDNFETHDTRRILPGTSFSIEPGIYIPGDIGLRTEIDVVIDFDGNVLVPSEPIQEHVIALLA